MLSTSEYEELRDFINRLEIEMPHIEGDKVINPTPLIDITEFVIDCARQELKINIDPRKVRILGKFESRLPFGSVKTRPAYYILKDAIEKGKLRKGSIVFEATSGNFGISLSMLTKLGIKVIVLISRKLQEGVLEELNNTGVKIIDLDIDICPAPGLQVSLDELTAKLTFDKIKLSLKKFGLDVSPLENNKDEILRYLIRQDVINLAKFLAKIYDGFCPEQYDNELNPRVHEEITAREIEQQLKEYGENVYDYTIVVTFGTGGTATGLSNYFLKKYGTKKVRVIFPLIDQDVAGIRTKQKAMGLRFYIPDLYLGEHEVDFEEAKKVLLYMNRKGFNIGESSALALYATIQMINFGIGNKFIVILPDGFEKYAKKYDIQTKKISITIEEAKQRANSYDLLLWTHGSFIPSQEALEFLKNELGIEKEKIEIASKDDLIKINFKGEIPERLRDKKKILLMCVGGYTSLKVAELLSRNGIEAQSIEGGLFYLANKRGRKIEGLIIPFK